MGILNQDRILLYHPLGLSPNASHGTVLRLTRVTPPLGLASLAAYMESRGFRADILDAYALGDHETADRQLRETLRVTRPGWLGITCTTSQFNDGLRVARLARTLQSDLRIVFGGPHVSALKERLLKRFPEIDAFVVGEGEQTLAELMTRGLAGAVDISGLTVRNIAGQVVFTGYRDVSTLKLDDLPFPAYDKLKGFPRFYNLPLFSYPKSPAVPNMSSRGCPYACSYCDRSVFGRSYRYYSADYVYHHLELLQKRYGVRHVTFYDDQFTYDRARVEQLCKMLIVKPLRMTFSCAVRPDHVDLDLIKQMKKAGCWTISFGIETGDAEILARYRHNPDLLFLAGRVRMVKRSGMRVKGLLMMGLPGENEASIHRSMKYVLSLPLDEIGIARFTPFPGTALYKGIRDLGEFDEDWDKMDCLNFQFVPEGMTRADLERLFTLFYRRYFLRPATLARYVSMMWRSPDSWRRFWFHIGTFGRFAFGKKS